MTIDQDKANISKDRYALAVEGAQDGLWDWDLARDRVFYSSQWKAMLGYGEKDSVSTSPQEWFKRVHPDDLEPLELKMEEHFQGKTDYFEAEYRMRTEKGYYIWILGRGKALRNKQGNPIRFVGLQANITEGKKREQQYLYDAFHDTLTSLPNRALFLDRLSQALLSRLPFAVLYMDLDRFKEVNDLLGHQAGDELLTMMADRIAGCSRAGDTIARLGGDEFALLLTNTSQSAEITAIAKRVLHEVSLPFILEDQTIRSTASMGIALGDSLKEKSSEEILRDADIALYRAKRLGKGGYVMFDEKMQQDTAFHFQLEADLKLAIKKNDLTAFYQPIVNLHTNQVQGVETLLRWCHEKYGLLTPGDFLRLVEEKNFIVPLEEATFKAACTHFASLQQQSPLSRNFFMTLNISNQYFRSEKLTKDIETILKKAGVNPSSVYLEIQERLIVSNRHQIGSIIKRIKGLGLKLILDDFGVGCSSLSSLHDHDFDLLKINRSLVSKMEKDTKILDLVKTIIQLATFLNLKVMAQGIESEKTLHLLKKLGCSYGQGFYFSKPLPMEELLPFFRKSLKKNI